MFIRFRRTKSTIQASIVTTRRIGGRVTQEHLAALGAVPLLPSIAHRVAFWQRLHELLHRLGNRIDQETQARLMADAHRRIPIVTPDEQRALQLQNAEADAEGWTAIESLRKAAADEHTRLAARVQAKAHQDRAAEQEAARRAAVARDRVERIGRGRKPRWWPTRTHYD